jgi:hypothetical protein
MPNPSASPAGYDVFLSHASPDKAWVRTLAEHLTRLGLRVFFDERELRPADNFVLSLSDGLLHSRFLVLVLTQHAVDRPWVEAEWTGFMARHGPIGRLIPLLLDPVALPPIIGAAQGINAADRNAERVAVEVARRVGRPAELKEGDVRRLYIGQDLVFVVEHSGEDKLRVTDPAGQVREVVAPWAADNRYLVAHLGFNKLTQTPVENDADRAELIRHAATLGELLFGVLFDGPALERLRQALAPGQARPLLTLRSRDDRLLALPWELLYHDGSFLVRDDKVDLARATLDEVGSAAVLGPPSTHFKLVVNVSAPAGSRLHYEAESYRLTKALSEHCQVMPTELGTLDDLVETVKNAGPTGIHFSGHGGPGRLVFEDDEGDEAPVSVHELVRRLRARVPGGLRPFFYLASCHGNEPGAPADGGRGPAGRGNQPPETAESSAARLHREGVAQVVGYYGPIVDELSTRGGRVPVRRHRRGAKSTFYAVRQARQALARPFRGGAG